MTRILVTVLTAGLVAAACSGGDDAHDGLLAVVDDAGEVVVLTGGGDHVATMTDLGDTATAFQPVWLGPDHVVMIERGPVSGALVVTSTSGDEQRRAEFATAPFYVYPRPGGSPSAEIVSLRSHLDGALAAEIVAEDGTTNPLDGEFTFFFTWTPDGSVVAHSGSAELVGVHPRRQPLPVAPGDFGAPAAWGDSLVVVRSTGSTSYLSVLSDEDTTDLATISGPTHLVVGGDRVAIRSLAGSTPAGGIEIAAQRIPAIPAEVLAVAGLEDGTVETVAPRGIVAFFWDPTARRLLYLDVVDAQASELAWHVWEDGATIDFPAFVPDGSWFLNFIPFFDQYAQSMTLWAPDGSAFAYPGRIGEESGIWVQHLDRDSPELISSGSWAAWGPEG